MITIKEVDSTNNFLKNILSNSKPLPEGTVIMAESQFAGRGQQQNRWHSEAGKNLTFSLLLNPAFLPVLNQFDLTRVISLGIFDTLKPLLGKQLKIKWPNDIYYGDRKLGGILTENILQGSLIKHSVIGIGLNVNQDTFSATLPNAISIRQILQQDYDLGNLLSEICSHIEAWYLKLKAGREMEIREAYLNTMYWLNERRSFKAEGKVFEAIIKNVKNNGILVVKNNIDTELEYNFKQIEFLNK